MASEAIIEQISQAIRQSGYAPDFGSNEMARALMPTLEEAVRAPLLAEIERLRGALARMGRDKETLLTFARAIQTWRSDADSYDEECDHPQRDYCEDVELMEKAAGYALRRIAERAALAGDSHDQ